MTITSIKARKDGKFLVGIHYNHGTNLSKIMTREQVDALRAAEERERQMEADYRKVGAR
jgi:hypothetical protein